MIKKIVFIILLGTVQANAVCYYITCAPSVSMATAIAAGNLEKSYLKINYQLDRIKGLYSTYSQQLALNNSGYQKNAALKVRYLVLLKQINETQKRIIDIKKEKGLN